MRGESVSRALQKIWCETYITFKWLCTTDLTTRENTVCSYIYFIKLRIIQWMRNNRAFLLSRIHVPKQTTYMHPYLHKIPPDDHHTRLHLHTIINTKILTHKHLHKILAGAHHTPLHPHTIIHKMLTTCWHFTSTRNVTNNNSHNIKIYPG